MGDRGKPRGRSDPPPPPKFDWPTADQRRSIIPRLNGAVPEDPFPLARPAHWDIAAQEWVLDDEAPIEPYLANADAAWTHAEVYPEASKIYDAALKMLCQKHMDYSATNISQAPGGAINGLRVRMHDKWARLNHLVETGAEPQNESLLDTLRDIQNYAVIWQMVLEGTWPS